MNAAPRGTAGPAAQSGLVMIVVLIALAIMALAGVALLRSIDAATAVTGNVAFSQASLLPANQAVEEAVAALFEKETISNVNADMAAENYFATRQDGDDARGIPAKLQSKSAAATLAKHLDGGNGNDIHYVIERLCAKGVPATPSRADLVQYCDMMPPKPAGTTTMETDKIELPRVPLFRVTVRVDGPRNTVSFMQAMLR
ncbi:MAG: hypothetical protein U1F10_05145 [Burkholderiales bacterium]